MTERSVTHRHVVPYFPYFLLVRVPLVTNLMQMVLICAGGGWTSVGPPYVLIGLVQILAIPVALTSLAVAGRLGSWRHLTAIACGGLQLAWSLELLRRIAASVDL